MSKEKIGFFGGSFNPVTNAHIKLIKSVIIKEKLDKVYFVPMGNLYEKQGLIDFKHRKNMIKLAIENEEKIDILDFLNDINHKMYAIDTFKLIDEKFKNADRYFIMGTDNYDKITNWKDAEALKDNYKYIVLDRKTESDTKEISSTIVRNKIINKESIEDLVPNKVKSYIYKNNLYNSNW